MTNARTSVGSVPFLARSFHLSFLDAVSLPLIVPQNEGAEKENGFFFHPLIVPIWKCDSFQLALMFDGILLN